MRVASSFPHWNPHRNYPRCSVNVSRVRFKRIVLTMTLATTKVITAHRYTPSINAFLYSDSCPALHGLQLHAPGAPLLPIVTFLPSSPRRQRENQSARTTRRGDGPNRREKHIVQYIYRFDTPLFPELFCPFLGLR